MEFPWSVLRTVRHGRILTKAVSILIIQSFILSSVAFALPQETSNDSKIPDIITNPEKINIPREFGLVKSKFTGNDGRLIVHIQDAHCNYEAQANIVKILENLIKNYNLSLVSVEGADGNIDTSWFKAFPDDDIRKEVAAYFMKKGEITGPEFLSITSNYSIKLFGAETRSYYIQNLNAFTSSYPLKEETEKYYTQIKGVLNRLKGYIYSEELKAMDTKLQEYDSKKIQFNDYVRFLQDMAERQKINLREYENFFKLVSTLIYEKKIDFTVTDKERGTLIDELSKRISKETLTELVTQSLMFKTGKISSVEYYHYLRDLSAKNGIDIAKDFPNLYNYIIYNSVYAKIENEKLFNDIKKVETAIKEKLFKNDDQRTLDRLSHNVDILLGLINIKLLNGDFDYYEANRQDFSYEVFNDFIKKKTVQYGFAYEIEPPSEAVANSIPKLEDFYSIAIKRDKALVDNTLGAMKKEKQQIAVLITGGFHSEGMAKLLEKQGISYMVICPTITKDVPTPYIQILTNQRTPLEDILVSAPADTSKKGMLAPYIISAARQIKAKGTRELNDLAAQIGRVDGRDLADRVNNFDTNWAETYFNFWIQRAELFAGRKSLPKDKEILLQAFKLAVDNAVAKNKISRENRDLVCALADRAFDEIYKAREVEFVQAAKGTTDAGVKPRPTDMSAAAKAVPFDKSPTAKKVPGTPALSAEDLVFIKDMIDKRPQGNVAINQEVRDWIKEWGPPTEATGLLAALNAGRIKVKWVDLGVGKYFFDRKNPSIPGAGAFYDDAAGTIYFPRAFILEANKYLLSQALVHEYVEEFGKEPEFGTRHAAAVAAEKLLSSPEAAREGVSDYTRFFLEKFTEKRDYKYFLQLLTDYDTRRDPGGDFLQLIYRSIDKITDPNGLLPRGVTLTTKEEVLAWYRYSFESSKQEYKGIKPYDKARLVSQKIDDMVEAGNISVELRNQCFFRKSYDNTSRLMIWIPQSFIRGPPEWFISIGYQPIQSQKTKALEDRVDALRRKIDDAIAELERMPEVIAAKQAQAAFESTEAWNKAWEAVGEAYTMMTYEEYLHTVDRAKMLWQEALQTPQANAARQTLEKVTGNTAKGIPALPQVEVIKKLNKELDDLRVQYYAEAHRPFLDFLYNQIMEKKKEKESRGDYSPIVVAISGSGGAGKSTLEEPLAQWAVEKFEGSHDLTETIDIAGVKVHRLKIGVIPTDTIGLHSAKTRYVEVAGGERLAFVKGHAMYSPDAINDALKALLHGVMIIASEDDRGGKFVVGDRIGYDREREGRLVKIILMEGITPAHFTEARDKVDIAITISEEDDSARFDRKVERDTVPKFLGGPRGLPRQHVINDFCDKQYVERHDMVKADMEEVSDVVWVYNKDQSRPSYIEIRVKPFYPRRVYGLPASSAINGFRVAFDEGMAQMISQQVSIEQTAIPKALEEITKLYYNYRGTACENMIRNFIKETIVASAKKYPIFARGWLASAMSKLDTNGRQLLYSIIDDIKQDARRDKKVVTVIPVGGRGARFAPFGWNILKPFYPLFNKSHFMHAVDRARAAGQDPKDIFFFIEKDMIEPAKDALRAAGINIPDENFIPETEGKDESGKSRALEKAAMFGMAAQHIAKLRGPETVIVFERSDLVLQGKNPPDNDQIMFELRSAIDDAATIASMEPTIGILGNPPTAEAARAIVERRANPPSGKGYIFPFVQAQVNTMVEHVFAVSRFHEKPELQKGVDGVELARGYVQGGATYNASYFVFKADTVLKAFEGIRPEESGKLTAYGAALGTPDEERVRGEVTDYFVRKAHRVAFEQGIVEPIAPVTGEPKIAFGLAMASLGPACSGNWVGSQGTLSAVWPTEKRGDNYFRPEGSDGRADIGPGVEKCNILLAPTDTGTVIHIKGAKGLAIAYEEGKKALVVVPVKETRRVDGLTATVKQAVDNSQEVRNLPGHPSFTEPGQPIPQVSMRVINNSKGSHAVLDTNGTAVILDSNNAIVYSQDGIVATTNLENTVVISIAENGVRNIYVYGPDALYEGLVKLGEMSPYAQESRDRLVRIKELIATGQMTPELSKQYAEAIAGSKADFEAGRIMGTFRKCYAERNGVLRDDVEALSLLITHPDQAVAKAAYPSWLLGIGNWLSDFHTAREMLVHDRVLMQTLQIAKNQPGEPWTTLNQKLNEYGLSDEEAMAKLHETLGSITNIDKRGIDRDKVTRIVVITRLKPGGDVSMNSIVFAKMKQMFPNAQILFVEGNRSQTYAELYAGDTRIQPLRISQEKEDTLAARTINAQRTMQAVEGVFAGLKQGEEAIVVDISVRFTHFGVFPPVKASAAPRNYFYYEEVSEEGVTLSEGIEKWLYATFDRPGTPFSMMYTYALLNQNYGVKAQALFDKFGLATPSTVAVTFGTAGDTSKQVSVPFETALIRKLLEEGRDVVLSKGDPREAPRVTQIIEALRAEGVIVDEVVSQDLDSYTPQNLPQAQRNRVIAFSGTLGEMSAVIQASQQHVGYSSAPKHIAGALRTPTTVIYVRGEDVEDKWEPHTPSAVNVARITPEQTANTGWCVDRIMQSVNFMAQVPALESTLQAALPLAQNVISNNMTMQQAVNQVVAQINPAMEAYVPAFIEMASQRNAASAYGVPDQVLAQALRMMQIAYLSRNPITENLNLIRYAWAGGGNRVKYGLQAPATGQNDVAEIWFGSTVLKSEKKEGRVTIKEDNPAIIPGTALKIGAVELGPIHLREVTSSCPEVLGQGLAEPSFFVKFLSTRFPERVHMGFNRDILRVGGRLFTEWLWNNRLNEEAILASLRNNLTPEEFSNYQKAYEEWTVTQALHQWKLNSQNPQIAAAIDKMQPFLNLDINAAKVLFDKVSEQRASIVSVYNEIPLEEGMVIDSPAGHPHAIFGLSHQTHPTRIIDKPDGTREYPKNEAWIIITVKDSAGKVHYILVEPQQMSNDTYSFADFYTPITWDSAKGRPVMRKSVTRADIDKFVTEGLFTDHPTSPQDFIRTPRDITPANAQNARVESLINETTPVWPEQYFIAERVNLNGRGAEEQNRASVSMPVTSFENIIVTNGEITIEREGKPSLVLKAGTPQSSCFMPATVGTYKITAAGEAQVLRFRAAEKPKEGKAAEHVATSAALTVQAGQTAPLVTAVSPETVPPVPDNPLPAADSAISTVTSTVDRSVTELKPRATDMAGTRKPTRMGTGEALDLEGIKGKIAEEQAECARELALCSVSAEDKDAILIVAVDTDIYAGKARNAISGLAGEVNGNTKPGSIVVVAGKGAELADKVEEARRNADKHNLTVRRVVTQLSAANATAALEQRLSENKDYVLKVTVNKDLSDHYMQVIRLFKLCFQIGYYNVEAGQGVDSIKQTLSMIMGRAVTDAELSGWLANKIIDILPKLEKIDMEATAVEAYKAVKKALTSL